MNIKQVSDVLLPAGLATPKLNLLVANENNYTVLLFQPQARIEASVESGVRHRDRCLANRQFLRFLKDAGIVQPDLAITPEYSMPWETLVAAIKGGAVPADGKLWALGCESIKYSELERIKQELAPFATVLYETLQPDPARLTDPLAYVFLAPHAHGTGAARIAVLVQFKTYPMGDRIHFEVNGLHRGTCIYQFGGCGQDGQAIRLVSLICSDAFAFTDTDAAAMYDRTLVIHIQLTRDPRQTLYRQYRENLLKFQGDATELICLNWARDVRVWCNGQEQPWHNIAGSAWYSKSSQFDSEDATLCANHRRGLYYTWLAPFYAHALFLNFEPATYLLIASKVAHIGVQGPISPRRGPQLVKTCTWDDASAAWVERDSMDDGFASIVGESGHAKDELERIADGNPIHAERVLALCAGKVGHREDWHRVRWIDSCNLDQTEVICRLTFCQDTHDRAKEFRVRRLKCCGHLWDIMENRDCLPPALADLKDGFRLEWSPHFPHQNALSSKGQRATAIYMGEDCSGEQIEQTAKKVAEYLHRSSSDSNESLLARQRLSVWSREHGKLVSWGPHRYVKIDQTGDTSEFDIGREE